MPLGTLDRTPPPFFKQGPSALSKLMVFSALSMFLMVADTRLQISQPIRAGIATVLYPAQWLLMQPVQLVREVGAFFTTVNTAQRAQAQAAERLARQAIKAGQAEALQLENARLRQMLALRDSLSVPAQAAEVLYDAADAFTRKVIVDRGQVNGVEAGSPVMDESGVLGQVTRVYPLVSEVTLLTDRDQAIPVLNTRTGVRGVAYGDPVTDGGTLELRFMPGSADVQVGDLLTTSGVDGVYPPGLPVARVSRVQRQADSGFARIHCAPSALVLGARHVLILSPLAGRIPNAPPPEPAAKPAAPRGARQ